jgi:hypothetical protein
MDLKPIILRDLKYVYSITSKPLDGLQPLVIGTFGG